MIRNKKGELQQYAARRVAARKKVLQAVKDLQTMQRHLSGMISRLDKLQPVLRQARGGGRAGWNLESVENGIVAAAGSLEEAVSTLGGATRIIENTLGR